MKAILVWVSRDDDDSGPLVWGAKPEKHQTLGWSADTDIDRKGLMRIVRKGECRAFRLVPVGKKKGAKP